MNIMSDAEYREFCKRRDAAKVEALKQLPIEQLEDLVAYQSSYVEGQLEHGMYDHDDLYGPGGHIRDLEVKRQALREVRSRHLRFENGRWVDLNGKRVQL